MIPSIIEQVTAATGVRIDPMQKYNIKRGSQTDVLHQLLDETGRGWTHGELQHKLGGSKNGLRTALHRLKHLGLLERDGVVEVDGRLHCRWRIRRDEELLDRLEESESDALEQALLNAREIVKK